MLGLLGRRTLDVLVLFLALYAFAFVPLGKRTGLDHVRAVFGTREAKEAGQEAVEAADRLRRRMLSPERPVEGRGSPRLPELPSGAPPNAAVAALDAPDASL